MLDIAVCDDDRHQAGALELLLYSLTKQMGITADVDVFESGESLLQEIYKRKCYDIIYLDIEMGGMNGLETAELLRDVDRMVPLVYVTSHEDYVTRSFDVTPSGYIKKPIDEAEFERVFTRIWRMIGNQDQYFRFSYKKTYYKVLIRDVLYFESDKRFIDIIWEGGRYRAYAKMDDIDKELSAYHIPFLRIHNSYLVNYRYVCEISTDGAILTDGTKLPVAKRRKKEIDMKMAAMVKG